MVKVYHHISESQGPAAAKALSLKLLWVPVMTRLVLC